ncbi:MAG: response regulator [Verrucomicrobiota bacterium]
MKKEVTILIADDDAGHARLIQKNFLRSGLQNVMKYFEDGQQVLDFFLNEKEASLKDGSSYLLLLDIRMPQIDGVEVLRQIKNNEALKKMPVIMLTTTDDPREVMRCHELGCNGYIVKPVIHDKFVDAIKNLGLYIGLVEVP